MGKVTASGGSLIARSRVSGVSLCASVILAITSFCLGMPARATAATAPGAVTQHGVALPTWYFDGYARAASDEQVAQIAQTGATWVAVGPELIMKSNTSSQILASAQRTSTDAGLIRVIAVAHANGLRVLLRPFVDSLAGSRTQIDPNLRATWFASYTRWMVHYAQLAALTGADELSIGADYQQLSSDYGAWARVIAAVRQYYNGPLTYDADIYEYRSVSFWRLLDVIGIDAYWPIHVPDANDPAQIAQAWQPILASVGAFAERIGKHVLFTEAGYRSVPGALANPGSTASTSQVDNAGQAAAYQGLLTATAKLRWFAGVFFWMWDAIGSHTSATDFTPHNKPAEIVLRHFWLGTPLRL